MTAYCKIHTEHMNDIWMKCGVLVVTPGGTYNKLTYLLHGAESF